MSSPSVGAHRRRMIRWGLVLLAVVALGGLIGYLRRPAPVAVSVVPVTVGTVERTVANTRAGTVKACRRAKLSPSIGGQIAVLPIKEGDRVKKGDPLLELWNDDLAAQVTLAVQEVNAAQARIESVCARAEVARRNAQRLLTLRQSNVGSEEQADNAVAEADSLVAECHAARIQVQVADARVAMARANLARTRLQAPFDGRVGEINGELFEYVTPSPLGVPTPPVVDIIGSGCFYVMAPIDEVDVAGIRVGMPVRISLDAFANRIFEGRVKRVADYVLDLEKQARTVDVEVAFVNPADLDDLLAGYTADIEVILQVHRQVTMVPTEAVINSRQVYRFLEPEGRVELRQLRMGLSNWDQTEVLEGLTAGDLVVVNLDAAGLKDGAAAVRREPAP
jgi:HlyD family secretion protein